MKKALFIDHSFHRKTRSADFFIDVVRQGFEVEVYYLTPEERPDPQVLAAAAQADVILCWQLDFLAPVFLAMGKPTIVIPMYDGSGDMPDLHWLFAGRARFFNFSLLLNERIRMLGCETMLLRYFPEPVPESELPRFDELSLFFWQRQPHYGIDHAYIHALIGPSLDHFHLHNAPDVPGNFRPQVPADAPYRFTESAWFKDKAQYHARLKRANVFVAPRMAEGIGMALLEAMAHGMLVLAQDAPTNNEYICSWVNGILFNKDHPPSSTYIKHDAGRIARMGWQTVVEGRRQWLDAQPRILEWIEGAEAGPVLDVDVEALFRDVWYSYYASRGEYQMALQRHLGLLSQLTPLPFDKLLDLLGEKTETADISVDSAADCALDWDGVLDLTHGGDGFIVNGWSDAEPEWRWAVGKTAALRFSGLATGHRQITARFDASALPNLGKSVRCTIALNGTSVFDGRVTPGWKTYEFSFAGDLVRTENRLTFTFEKAMSLATDARKLAICFKSIAFTAD